MSEMPFMFSWKSRRLFCLGYGTSYKLMPSIFIRDVLCMHNNESVAQQLMGTGVQSQIDFADFRTTL